MLCVQEAPTGADGRPEADWHLHVELLPPHRSAERLKVRASVETALGDVHQRHHPRADRRRAAGRAARRAAVGRGHGPDDRGRVTTVVAFAPGRVNLIGDHTDHTGGFCFPMAIGLGVTVRATVGGEPGPAAQRRPRPGSPTSPSTSPIPAPPSRRGPATSPAWSGSCGRRSASTASSARRCRPASGCRRAPRSRSPWPWPSGPISPIRWRWPAAARRPSTRRAACRPGSSTSWRRSAAGPGAGCCSTARR